MIALVRTSGSPDDRKHGLSQLIIDLKLPGVTVRPIPELTGDAHFCEVHFDNVRLGEDALIGREGDGWAQVNAELAFERSGPERLYSSIVLLDTWIDHVRSFGRSDVSTILIGKIVGRLAALRAMSIAITAKLAAGESPLIEAALVKDIGTTLEQAIPNLIADVIGMTPFDRPNESLFRTLAYVTQIAPAFSLRGGTREILRGVIAHGLGLR
jgi:alkylation response protein AidB-like acyl-CoA dehydrogenase